MNAPAAKADAPDEIASGEALLAHIGTVSSRPLSEPAQILCDKLFEKHPDCAVLFYGSGNSVGATEDPTSIVFDFYVIGESYDALYDSSWLRIANRILPPNVFYIETPSPTGMLRAKYAVLTLDHFEKLVSPETFHSYFWARFAQPCRIVDPKGDFKDRLEHALADAVTTFCTKSVGLMTAPFTARDLWLAGLGVSYKAELRAEQPERTGKLIDSYGDWAGRVTAPALRTAGFSVSTAVNGKMTVQNAPGHGATAFAWRVRALFGAILSALRLLKGAQTFHGGIDYIAWKIKRHTGIDVGVSEWERRHPMLATPKVALRYYRMKGRRRADGSQT